MTGALAGFFVLVALLASGAIGSALALRSLGEPYCPSVGTRWFMGYYWAAQQSWFESSMRRELERQEACLNV